MDDRPPIDVHGHTFNGRYLPLEGIALGKRDATWLTPLVPDRVARGVARFLYGVTELPPLAGTGDASSGESEDLALRAGAETCGESVERFGGRAAVRGVRKTLAACRAGTEPELSRTERLGLRALGVLGSRAFLGDLVAPDTTAKERHARAFGTPHELLVSHTMDLGPVYAEAPAPGRLLDFESEQLPRTRRVEQGSGGALVHFVAYNPFRDHWPEAAPGRALRIVEDAIAAGARGVKLYPPSGYRPTGNAIPRRPWTWSASPRRQWRARYRHADGSKVTGEELDRRIDELLGWCERGRVPVFVHCNVGEFEARKGYGKRMADPRWWEAWMERRAREHDACRLRLCFGHAGGAAFWFGGRSRWMRRWGETVHRLCTSHPSVYCEVGVHDEITRPRQRERFVERLAELLARPSAPGVPPFAERLIYGSDWFMPIGSTRTEYLAGYRQAFADPRLAPHAERFFRRNARDFLAS